ncbi:LOW QUALITY PROTEIN: fibroblast growth factor 22 [Manis pentadactyla]|uniref:LOW QUALITY PROTEIN: fibroblast growth factor 22 n=1 Tax=Manis pentadactyla TaxID=143292 RepID=UPI00255C5FFA|nr:LOW QUALITY PROTEIN: fibroblast growth factor 22 [Manis pentadactyla]
MCGPDAVDRVLALVLIRVLVSWHGHAHVSNRTFAAPTPWPPTYPNTHMHTRPNAHLLPAAPHSPRPPHSEAAPHPHREAPPRKTDKPARKQERLPARGQSRGRSGRRELEASGARAVPGRLWLVLAWLLLAHALGAAGAPGNPRRPRSYPHLEGEVRWRLDPSGRVQDTRRRHRPGSILEIRSVCVGAVALKAMHLDFYVAMSCRGCLYGSRVCSVHCSFRERIEENGYNTYASLHWHHNNLPMFLALDGRDVPVRRGSRTQRHHLSSHFLLVLVS